MLGSIWSWLYWPDLALFHAATLTNRQLSFLSPPGVAAPFVPAGLVSENRTTNAAGKYCCARRGNTDTTQCKKASHPCPPAVTSMSQAPQARFRQNQTVWFGLDKPQVFAVRAQLRSAYGWISALRSAVITEKPRTRISPIKLTVVQRAQGLAVFAKVIISATSLLLRRRQMNPSRM